MSRWQLVRWWSGGASAVQQGHVRQQHKQHGVHRMPQGHPPELNGGSFVHCVWGRVHTRPRLRQPVPTMRPWLLQRDAGVCRCPSDWCPTACHSPNRGPAPTSPAPTTSIVRASARPRRRLHLSRLLITLRNGTYRTGSCSSTSDGYTSCSATTRRVVSTSTELGCVQRRRTATRVTAAALSLRVQWRGRGARMVSLGLQHGDAGRVPAMHEHGG